MPAPFTVFSGSDATTLTAALLATNSGVTINSSSVLLHASGSDAVNFYDGSLTALGIGSGLLLTTGTTPGANNTIDWFGQDNSIYPDTYFNGDAAIDAVVNTVFQTQSFDATTLSFDFSVADPAATSVSFEIVFGSDEYPEWVDQFVDCAIVTVNGVNYALFNHDPMHPLSVVSSNLAAGYFQNNAADPITGLSPLPIEYDGVSHVLTIVAPIITGGATNHIKIGIADTGDHIYDSGIFIANFSAGTIPGSGVVVAPPGQYTDSSDTVTGSSQDEYFDLKGGNDTVYAGGGDDIVVAGSGNDALYGGSGNDELKGDAGNDYLDGGDGLADTAVFAGASTSYSVQYSALDNTFSITDSVSGLSSEGTDTLTNIELVKFSDGLFNLNATGLTPATGTGSGTGSGSGTGTTPPPNSPGFAAISGIGSVGHILTATVSDPDGISGTISYQWQHSTDNGASWSDIPDALSNTYQLLTDDVGNLIQVVASYTDDASVDEWVVSPSKAILPALQGNLLISLIQLDAPPGTSVINPLTTLLKDAVDLGLTPNLAALTIKTVLGLPSEISLQNYDSYAVLQVNPNDPTAIAVEMVAVQIAILTSLSDDDTGMTLTLSLLASAANNQTVNLSNINDLATILGVEAIKDPVTGKYPQPLDLAYDRNRSLASAIADGGNVVDIEKEWQDFIGTQDGINSTSISDLSIHINQNPFGSASFGLQTAFQNESYIISSSDLLLGFSDSDGGLLEVSYLSADKGGTLQSNPDGTWTFIPDQDYTGPVELTYTILDGQGGSAPASQFFVVAAVSQSNVNNLPTGEVIITGTAEQGQILTADTSTLADADGLGAISFQWQADGIDIIGATGTTYTPTQDDAGKSITVLASYTDGAGTPESVISAATNLIADVDLPASGILAVTGVAEEGGTLDATLADLVDPDGAIDTTSYQWQENVGGVWINLDGQNGTTLAIPSDQSYVGKSLRVVVTTTDLLGGITDFIGDSQTIANVNDAPVGGVSVNGTAEQGQTLTADISTLADDDGLGTISYQWQAGGLDITGATEASYSLTQAEVGKVITVAASYTDGQGTLESVNSLATDIVANIDDAATGTLVVAGSAAEGAALVAALINLVDLDGAIDTTLYQWQENVGGLWINLDGQNSATLAIPSDQSYVGKSVRVVVTTTDLLGGVTDFTGDSQTIANVNDAPVGLVSITGTAQEGQTLTASNTLSDADGLGTISYQWQADGINIGGATGSSYTLTLANVGKAITVAASYIDGFGTPELVGSAATAIVTALTGATLTGTAGADILNGTFSNDTLNGLAGNDKLNGLAGNDILDGGAGIDTLAGGLGDDSYVVDNTGDKVVENAAEGTDQVMVTISTAGLTYTLSNNVENAQLANTVAFNLTGNTLANLLTGNAAANILNGGAGIDTLVGGAGNDTYVIDSTNDLVTEALNEGSDLVKVGVATAGGTYTLADNVENATLTNTVSFSLAGNSLDNLLIGNAAANTLTGGAGNDTLTGGTGLDTFVVDAGTDTITDLGNGASDILTVSSGATANATVSVVWMATAASVNNGTANVTTNGLEVNLAAITTGSNGFNVINNGRAAMLTGSAFADTLTGGTGKDTLVGGNGDDLLVGGNGNDSLTGGAGKDTFRFSAALGNSNIDAISDFTSGSDKLELLLSLFSNIKGTDGVFTSADILIGAGATKGSALGNEHLIFNTSTKALYYDADGSGAGAGVQFATLTGVATLAYTDVVLI
ncbi:MAG: hypothetical protein FDX18_10685 [Chlorobium sp.]|nr:MAG: hypothetical protein FDX18_10685 [Chlorobium sp.]